MRLRIRERAYAPSQLAARMGAPLPLLVLLALLLLAPTAQSIDWKRYDSEKGGFSIDLPGEPIIKEKKTWFPMASFVSYAYRALVGDDAFGLNHTDLPRAVTMFVPESKIVDSTRQGMLEDVNATEISFREVRFADQKAHEMVYSIPPQDGRPAQRGVANIFFKGRRLYVFWVEARENLPKADLDHYFQSVRIWED